VQPRLEELIAEWEPRTTGKQRITAMRLHRQLRTEGHQVGRTLVGDYWRERRRQRAEVYVPLVNRPGEAQVDFFEVVVEVGGERRKAWEFLLRLMYSGREFAWLYERCDQLAFLDGHVRAFAHLGGVARRCVYDNLAAAVRKIVGARRELTGRFLALVSHYLFEPDFARIGEGHDKGGVESRGKAIRLEHLTPIPRGDSLEAISRQLLAEVDAAFPARHRAGRSVSELWAEERMQLLSLPATSFEVRKAIPVAISSRAMVRIEGAWYSVPSRWARLAATAYLGVDDVRITCMGESVTHPRTRFGMRQVRYRHYLPELARKRTRCARWRRRVDRGVGRTVERIVEKVVRHARRTGSSASGGPAARRGLRTRRRSGAPGAGSGHQPAPPRRAGSPRAGPKLENVAVPNALAAYVVEAGRASDYDHLLFADGAVHE
jgi:transposase